MFCMARGSIHPSMLGQSCPPGYACGMRRVHVAALMTGNQNEEPPVLPPSVSEISSTSNAYVKHCVRLRSSSRYRQETGRCLLVGRDLLEEAAGEIMGRRLGVACWWGVA